MNSGCQKFLRLSEEERDRPLTTAEQRFREAHRETCEECRHHEACSHLALNMLRAAAIEVDASPQFDQRVLRLVRVRSTKESLTYWKPAFIGAGIACALIALCLQMITQPDSVRPFRPGLSEARLEPASSQDPRLELSSTNLRLR